MRGLDTRVLLAKARIMLLVDAKKAGRMLATVEIKAKWDGVADAGSGYEALPMMFDDEPVLASRWYEGQMQYRECDRSGLIEPSTGGGDIDDEHDDSYFEGLCYDHSQDD